MFAATRLIKSNILIINQYYAALIICIFPILPKYHRFMRLNPTCDSGFSLWQTMGSNKFYLKVHAIYRICYMTSISYETFSYLYCYSVFTRGRYLHRSQAISTSFHSFSFHYPYLSHPFPYPSILRDGAHIHAVDADHMVQGCQEEDPGSVHTKRHASWLRPMRGRTSIRA
jgi:hypothetical protein